MDFEEAAEAAINKEGICSRSFLKKRKYLNNYQQSTRKTIPLEFGFHITMGIQDRERCDSLINGIQREN